MKRSAFAVAAIALALTASASAAQAQRPVSLGIAAGAAVPTGDLGDFTSMGYNLTGSIGYSLPAMPLSFRVDGMYNQLSGKEVQSVSGPDLRIMAVTANTAYTLPGVAVRPYVIAGAGYYSIGGEALGQSIDRENKRGVNGGAGFELPLTGISTFVEARYHSVFTEGERLNMFPVSVGIRF